MNRMKKTAVIVTAAAMLTVGSIGFIQGVSVDMPEFTASAADIVASGECGAEGANVVWQFDSDGKLTISGTGEMDDWDLKQPWYDYVFDIVTVEVKSGVTYIGDMAFNNFRDMTSISLPDSVTSIGESAFFDCRGITSIEIPDGVTVLNESVFYNCTGLESVTLSANIKEIKFGAFQNCEKLSSITFNNPECKIYDYKTTICNSNDYETGEAAFSGTIYGHAGSTAQAYAEKYGRKFAVIGGNAASADLGDVNKDGKVDSADASLVLSEYGLIQTGGNLTFTDAQKKSADVNKDGKTDSSDASKILEYYGAVSTGKNPTWD